MIPIVLWLAACWTPAAPGPSAPPAVPAIHVEVEGKPVVMRSGFALLDPYDHIVVVFSNERRACAKLDDDYKPRPGEVWFVYEIAPNLHADGTSGWARRAVGLDGNDSDEPNLEELGPDAVIEPRSGGRVRFRIADARGAPLVITPKMTASGPVDLVICPTESPAAAAPATGFAEIAGRRYPLAGAILAGGPSDPNPGLAIGLTDRYGHGTTFVIPVVSGPVSCANEYLLGTDVRLEVVMSDDATTLRYIRLTGAQIPSAAVTTLPSFTITPAVAELHGDRDVEISGSGSLRSNAHIDPNGHVLDASGPAYAVKLGGTLHVLDCRGA